MPYVQPAPKGLPPLDMAGESGTVTRKQIDVRHDEWKARQELRFNVAVLYEGGDCIRKTAASFLKQRPREDSTVYQYRLDNFCYENNLGTGLGWHEAEMFKQAPLVDIKLAGTDAKPNADQSDFYTRYQANCDRKGTSLVDQFRKVFTDALLHGESWILTDFPARDESIAVESLRDEKELRLLDPYTRVVSPLDVINWECDDEGNLAWVIIYTKTQTRQFLQKPQTVERWYYYDRQTYRVYQAIEAQDVQATDNSNQPVDFIAAGYHSLALQKRVPLERIITPAGWWMGNRTYLACLEHVNVSNALKWSLFMAALAVPVVITDDDVSNVTQTETGFLHFGIGSRYMFAEPTGTCWTHLAARAERLTEEIYRSMYLIAQARTNSATAAAQSGVSKEADRKPSHDVLNGLGDMLRVAMQRVLHNVAAARAMVPGYEADTNLLFGVTGFKFDESVTSDQVDTLSGLHSLAVPSKRFEKLLDKQITQAALPRMTPDDRTAIFAEIDSAPTRAELEQQRQAEEAKRMAAQLTAAVHTG